jgi:hypothetical protein
MLDPLIYNTLSSDGFFMTSKALAKLTSNNAAILAAEIIHMSQKGSDVVKTPAKYFERECNLSKHARQQAEQTLIDVGALEVKKTGTPAKNVYLLHSHVLKSILSRWGVAHNKSKNGTFSGTPDECDDDHISDSSGTKTADKWDENSRQVGRKQPTGTPVTPSLTMVSGGVAAPNTKEDTIYNTNHSPTPPSGESNDRQRYHGKRSRGKEKIAYTQSPAVDVASLLAIAGEPDPPAPIGAGVTEAGAGAAITGGSVSVAAEARSPRSDDPTLKKDGTPRADAPEMKFLQFYVAKYEEILGTKPIIGPYGRTTVVIRNILTKMDGRKQELMRIVDRYLRNQDPWYIQTGWSLMTLSADNTLNAHSDAVWAARAAKQTKSSQSQSRSTGRRLDE